MSDLISRSTLIRDIKESRAYNPHKDGKIRFNHDTEHQHFLRIVYDQPVICDMDTIIEKIASEMFSAELHGDEWDGQTVDNLLCMGDVYEILKGAIKDD